MMHRRIAWCPIVLACCLLHVRASLGDRMTPHPRLFVSDNHEWALQVTPGKPPYSRARASLIELTRMGEQRTIWTGTLVNLPQSVYVSTPSAKEKPHFATIGSYGLAGGEHALVIYTDRGKVLKDYPLDRLVTPEELRTKVKWPRQSRFWANGARFDRNQPDLLVITLISGGERVVNLRDGRLSRENPAR